jgi:hypothetical protein
MVVTAPSCKSTVASGACTRKAEPPVISYSLTRPCDKTARTIILAKSKSETASTTLSLAREAALRCTSCPAIDGRATGIVVKGQHEDASARIHHSNRHANRRGWRVIETESRARSVFQKDDQTMLQRCLCWFLHLDALTSSREKPQLDGFRKRADRAR